MVLNVELRKSGTCRKRLTMKIIEEGARRNIFPSDEILHSVSLFLSS